MSQKVNLQRRIICFPILLYQWLISPLRAPCCRFEPSCSQYAIVAIQQEGIWKGLLLALLRLLRCHPWSTGGYDPVKTCKKPPKQ